MSAPDLSYSLVALESLGGDLLAVADVMDGASPAVAYHAQEIGHRLVHDALQYFSRNWDDKRELLTTSLRAVGQMAQDSGEVLRGVDDALAAEVAGIMGAAP